MNDIFTENYNKLKKYAEVLAYKYKFQRTGISGDIVHHAWFMFKENEPKLIEKKFPINYLTCQRFVKYSALRHFTATYTQLCNLVKPNWSSHPSIDLLIEDLHPTNNLNNELSGNFLKHSFLKNSNDKNRNKVFLLKIEGYTHGEISKKLKISFKKVTKYSEEIKTIVKNLTND